MEDVDIWEGTEDEIFLSFQFFRQILIIKDFTVVVQGKLHVTNIVSLRLPQIVHRVPINQLKFKTQIKIHFF